MVKNRVVCIINGILQFVISEKIMKIDSSCTQVVIYISFFFN